MSEDIFGGLTREEWLARHDSIRAKAWADALATVEKMELASEVVLPPEIPGLSRRANRQYAQTYVNLKDKFPGKLAELMAYAQWVKWVSLWDGAHWCRNSREQGAIPDEEFGRLLDSAVGYAAAEGWAYTVFNKLSEFEHQAEFGAVATKFGLKKKPSDEQVLTALELHWLWLASESDPVKDELLEWLHEAGDAKALANGLYMWEESKKACLEEIESDPQSKLASSARRSLAKNAAGVRHAQNQAVREQVVARYKAEKDTFSSKDAAAIAFTKDFPFEFSTIRDWLKGA